MAKDYSTTRKPISNTLLGKVAEVVGIKEGLNPNQKRIKLATMSQKVVKQALKRAGILGFAASEALDFIMDAKPKKSGKGQMDRFKKKDTLPEPKMKPNSLKKDTPPETPPKKPQQFNLKTGGKGDAKTRLNEIQKEKLAAKQKKLVKGSQGVATGLKMPTADQTGLKKLPTPVRNKMGYMYGGGMMNKKPRMSSMDYRKGGLLVISVDMMKNKKKSKEK